MLQRQSEYILTPSLFAHFALYLIVNGKNCVHQPRLTIMISKNMSCLDLRFKQMY